jgi:DNA mismatch repair protein MutS2
MSRRDLTGGTARPTLSRVNARALGMVEFPAILDRLVAAAGSEPGRTLAAGLTPSPHPAEVEQRQHLTTEAVGLLDAAAEPDLGGIADVRAAAALAERGSTLEPPALRAIAVAIRGGLAARRALEAAPEATGLLALSEPIDPGLARVADEIERAVEDDGSGVRDSASSRLRSLRRQLRDGRLQVAERLRKLARDSGLREHLQEDFVTERGGRPVLAVKASARGNVPGIVHDASSSGQTLFVEPLAVVDDNNRLREAESAEREEVERILRELAALVAQGAAALDALVEAVGAIDLALACATLSRRWRGCLVTISHEVVLRGARHPLLDPATAVPVDLDLGDLRALVISGPNTGGKTVALKTLGLAAALHQAGLRPPATEAALPVFDQVLVDIGDEQSIEMSLSTFSGHVRNLLAILEAAGDRSLVLLDEVAAGTDPVEGAALAQALLSRLAGQARLTVATSHYPELKEWASATDGVANAATGFDAETHAPLYRVALGRPGTSHALQIAERLGLPAELVADARARVAPERLRVAELLAEAEAAEQAARDAGADAEAERSGAAEARRAAEERERELLEEVERVRASAQAERERALAQAERELGETRGQLEELRREIRAARKLERERRRAPSPAAARAERERDRRLGAASDRAARAREALPAIDELPPSGPLAPGDPVVAPAIGIRGTVAEVAGNEAVVLGLSGQRIRVALDRLRPDRDARARAEASPEPAVSIRATGDADVPDELDLRGRTAQEAREAVRAFVDAAALAGRPDVRVIHGRGTGAVRAAVRDELARHPLVESHESESADGATVARLGGGE